MSQFILEQAIAALKLAAPIIQSRIQDRNGELYSLVDVEATVISWFNESIAELAEDAAFHCVEGDRVAAFNRHGFDKLSMKLQPTHQAVDSV